MLVYLVLCLSVSHYPSAPIITHPQEAGKDTVVIRLKGELNPDDLRGEFLLQACRKSAYTRVI